VSAGDLGGTGAGQVRTHRSDVVRDRSGARGEVRGRVVQTAVGLDEETLRGVETRVGRADTDLGQAMVGSGE
jgi:hypothetical protein